MVNVNREVLAVRAVANGRSGIVGVTEAAWVQVEAETCQEILDWILMAYRLAEVPDILLPVMVGYDGYYLSHLMDLFKNGDAAAIAQLGNLRSPEMPDVPLVSELHGLNTE